MPQPTNQKKTPEQELAELTIPRVRMSIFPRPSKDPLHEYAMKRIERVVAAALKQGAAFALANEREPFTEEVKAMVRELVGEGR